MIFASISSSCSTLAVPMREVPCMGSPLPAVHAKWSLVFWSFATSSQRLKAALNFVYNNNSGLRFNDIGCLMLINPLMLLDCLLNDIGCLMCCAGSDTKHISRV